MPHAYDAIPELAGLATYESASRIGFSVNENVRRLLRYHWTERRLMQTLVAHLPSMPIWEAKCAMALHQWQCAEHVAALRQRIGEMRSPVPDLDTGPDDDAVRQLDELLEELDRTSDPLTFLSVVYGSVFPALAASYREHIEKTNPLVDHPTRRLLRMALQETEDAIAWSDSALAAISADTAPHRADADHLLPRFHPRRDERFHGQYNFEFPPHIVYNMADVPPDERNLALLCKRALEMDVPEMMASFMTERADQPWEFYHDYSRQLWDEARHSMMGTVALEARGIDWKKEIPLNVSFALRLNLHATPIERQMMLYAIEQSLMPGETGKRYEHQTARDAGDALSAHFHDYDWADEVLHAQIGRRALKRDGISSEQAAERAHQVHEKTWAALERYRHLDAQENWWPQFVKRALKKESAVAERSDLGPVNVFAE
ncbi:MAG TPA: hypothetical protein VFT29_00020 [Gemmatimonadaceae bacterium]|nr:hypothetical protein [Gemmatimonadaceae bacterium]